MREMGSLQGFTLLLQLCAPRGPSMWLERGKGPEEAGQNRAESGACMEGDGWLLWDCPGGWGLWYAPCLWLCIWPGTQLSLQGLFFNCLGACPWHVQI